MNDKNRRVNFRLTYPNKRRASLILDVDNYEVIDVSECGAKVKTNEDTDFVVDDSFMAIIALQDGREFDLSGHVVHVQQDYAGLKFETPLPKNIIKSEYRLASNF